MACHSHLFRRGAQYYFRLAVPESLRPLVGKSEFRKSLGTANYAEAVERLALEEYATRKQLREAKGRLSGASSRRGEYLPPVLPKIERLQQAPASSLSFLAPAPLSAAPAKAAPKGITVQKLTEQFMAEMKKAGKAPKTLIAYSVSARLVREAFGERRDASALIRADAEQFCTILETMPKNAAKRYPGLSVIEAIAKAKKAGDTSRLHINTRKDHFFTAYSIFKFGKETRQLADNLFDDRLLKQRFTPKQEDCDEQNKRPPFTIEQLNKIFRSPLYTGCQDDERGYSKPGLSRPRRARFWIPLLALFHGMRENEICQLHTADIKEIEGSLFIDIRPGADKRLKNKPSRRTIPVHPELLKIGFQTYVEKRKQDTRNPSLFPELLPSRHTGSYSDVFSKWFILFLKNTFGEKIRPTFHSFRHTFVDACRNADLSPQRIDRLCGWAGEGRQQREYGSNQQLSPLAVDIMRVNYEGLNLQHLYAVSKPMQELASQSNY